MKIILLKDVKNMGRANDVKEVSDGHALNFLLPRKLAVIATPATLAQAEQRTKQKKDSVALDAKLLAQNIASLAEARIVIRAKANEKGHLYNAVGESEVIEAAKAQARIDIPEGIMQIKKPFKELGTFDIPVSSGEVFGKFSITIEAE
jgi:large subunit ribosomal protein L9